MVVVLVHRDERTLHIFAVHVRVINGDYLHVGIALRCAQDEAADSARAVDANAQHHVNGSEWTGAFIAVSAAKSLAEIGNEVASQNRTL